MKHPYYDGGDSRLYMHFDKILPSAQGMGIWEDRAYILYDTGVCAVHDLKTKSTTPLAQFPLGSYNNGTPSREYLNHANSCMFSGIHYQGNPIPLLYVTIGTGIGYDADGYYYRCAVENIVEETAPDGSPRFTAQTIQTISYCPEGIEETPFEAPCWGCPAFFVDSEKQLLYLFSARYRTKREHVPADGINTYIITTFRLPDLSVKSPEAPLIHLTPQDILDQFTAESEVLFTQGGTLLHDKIYYTFGCPAIGYPLAMLVFDLEKRCICAQMGHMDEAFAQEEIECCAPYDGQLLCNTCDGSIYVVQEGRFPL